jgi:uncharacterized protein (DUF2267 family)
LGHHQSKAETGVGLHGLSVARPASRQVYRLLRRAFRNYAARIDIQSASTLATAEEGDDMSATGLDVFDKTLQTTNTWLDELMADIGPDRQVAWHVLGAVLRTVRDRVPGPLAAHLGAQLPLLVRGAFYDGYRPQSEPLPLRDQEAFLAHVGESLHDIRPVNVRVAVRAVFDLLSTHLTRGQCDKVRDALPDGVRQLWRLDEGEHDVAERAAAGRAAQNAHDARAFRARGGKGNS